MEIHSDDALGTGHGEEVRHELGADGGAGAGLAVLTGIAEIGDDGRNAAGTGALEGVQQEAEFHQGLVGRSAGGLDHEHVVAAHAGTDLHAEFTVAESSAESGREGAAEVVTDVHGQLGICRTRDDLEVAVHRNRLLKRVSENAEDSIPAEHMLVAGAAGLEPANGGTKTRCLTAWLHPTAFRLPRQTHSRKGPYTAGAPSAFSSAFAARAAVSPSRKRPNRAEPLPLIPAMSAPCWIN